MKTIKELVNDTIAVRNANVKIFSNYKDELEKLDKFIEELNSFVKNEKWTEIIKEKGLQSEWVKVVNEIKKIDSDLKVLGFRGEESGKFIRAYNRITRGWVNLGIVGTFRQGKSTLLKKIIRTEKFDNSILFPVKGGDDACTGAPVNYINELYEDKNSNEKYSAAVIKYYTDEEVCNNINDYIEACQLNAEQWKPLPPTEKTKEGLKNYCKSHKNDAEKIEDALPNTLRLTLKNMITEGAKNDSYIDLLNQKHSICKFDTEEGRKKYMRSISFYETLDDNLNSRKFDVYATKEADVYVNFELNGEEVGGIRFLDTPGIGEQRLGVNKSLSEKLENDIDLVIAINKLDTGKQDDNAVNDFHKILKNKFDYRCTTMEGKEIYSKQFIYYIINLALSEVGDAEQQSLIYQRYKRIFQDGLEAYPQLLDLDPTHKLIINCDSGIYYEYQVNAEEQIIGVSQNKEQNCEKFLLDAVQDLSTSIGDIDEYFTNEAIELYNIVVMNKSELMNHLNKIVVPCSYNFVQEAKIKTTEIFDGLTKCINNIDITKDISDNISEYADANTVGDEVMKLIGVDEKDYESMKEKARKNINNSQEREDEEDDEDDEEKFINSLASILIDKYNGSLCSDYEAVKEFATYSVEKKILHTNMVQAIENLIDSSKAEKKIEEKKNEVFTCLKSPNLLGFVADKDVDNEKWYNKLIHILSMEGYASLRERIISLHDFSLDVPAKIKDFVADDITPKFHNDNFDNQTFNNLSLAKKAFLRSLLMIEAAVKDHLRAKEDGLIKSMQKKCNKSFRDELEALHYSFYTLTPDKDEKAVKLYGECLSFITEHMKDILDFDSVEDENLQRQALIEQWSNINKRWKTLK